MESLRKLLLDPGRSFAGYVLRTAFVAVAVAFLLSWLIFAILPAQTEAAVDLVRSQMNPAAAAFDVLVAPIASTLAMWVIVLAARWLTKDVLVTSAIAGLAAGIAIGLFYDLVTGLVAIWVCFVAAVAGQVGAHASWRHALFVPVLVLLVYDATVLLYDAVLVRTGLLGL